MRPLRLDDASRRGPKAVAQELAPPDLATAVFDSLIRSASLP